MFAASPDQPLIDCRPFVAYFKGHVRNATSLPADELFERMHELPMRSQVLNLCGDRRNLQSAMDYLQGRQHNIGQCLEWTQQLAEQLQAQNMLETGSRSLRLWKPSPLIKTVVKKLPEWKIHPGTGLDIACGAGRDMVYLAENGWHMTGVDYHEDALSRARHLATVNRQTLQLVQQDLESGDQSFVDAGLGAAGFDLVSVLRYLHRPLLPQIKELLAPGGLLVYQTFMLGCEKIGRPRNPDFLLKPGELRSVFSGFSVLMDDVSYLEDGRPVSAFVAQKPGL